MNELAKLKPLASYLTKLSKALRPGRRFDNLKREFRTTWLVEHQYNPITGECEDKVEYRLKEIPRDGIRKADSKIRDACTDVGTYVPKGHPNYKAARNMRKNARRVIRNAGGVVV